VLKHNEFHSYLPEWLCELESLKHLDLERNEFDGIIPNCIGSMNLTFLELTDNPDLAGEFPTEICDLVELETLGIGETSIEGIITSLIQP
jgi:hypothetical protein